jgi:hypothetical protein
MDLGFHLHHTQLFRGRMVGAAGPRICPHLGPPPPMWLDPKDEEHPHKVNPGHPLLLQLLKVLTQRFYFAEVLPGRRLHQEGRGMGRPLVNIGSGAETSFFR